ncbi:hypothetical protein DFJ73DRAFT_828582 [Zopfochytrium polystomum]|nr:hypothetical protein DFJ73DRAFT_828582 [Zopfochytrium polystomum]
MASSEPGRPGSSSSKPKRTSISWTSPLVLLRAAILTLVLDGGCIAINTIQYPSLLLLHVLGSHALYRSYIRVTERLFGVVLVVVMSLLCPLEIVLTGDHRSLDATSRTLIMANHQIYTDWAYLWIVAWSKGAHGDIKIILKEDLKWIPVVGTLPLALFIAG